MSSNILRKLKQRESLWDGRTLERAPHLGGAEGGGTRRRSGKYARVRAWVAWGKSRRQNWFPQSVGPGKVGKSEGSAGRNSGQEASMRTQALGIYRHLGEGAGLPAGRGSEAGAKAPRPE